MTIGDVVYVQHVLDCGEHDDCTAIVCTFGDEGPIVWVSHAPTEDDPAGRINPDVVAYDRRDGADDTLMEPT